MDDQSRENIILCVLSALRPVTVVGKYYTPPVESGIGPVPGFQTNEAPLYYLLLEAQKAGKPINSLIYLVSEECTKPIVGDGLSFVPDEGLDIPCPNYRGDGSITTTQYLEERLMEFVESHDGLNGFSFNEIRYDVRHPDEALRELNAFVSPDTGRISIDTTGGPRDAVTLLTMALQVIKQRCPNAETGPIVYSNLHGGVIENRDVPFGFTDLISAAKAFTTYGKADQFCSYFDHVTICSRETKQLCSSMKTFSNSLSFCVVKDLPGQAYRVQDNLKRAEEKLTRQEHSWELASGALNILDHEGRGSFFDIHGNEYKLEDVICELNVKAESGNNSDLRRKLENVKARSIIGQEQSMLLALIPSIREGFIQTEVDNDDNGLQKAQLILECVSWCANHQLVHEALQIFREHVSFCLINMGYIIKTGDQEPAKPLDFVLINSITETRRAKDLHLIKKKKSERADGTKKENDEYDYGKHYAINEASREALYEIFKKSDKLRDTRNWVCHNEESKEEPEIHTIEGAQQALLDVVKMIEENRPESIDIKPRMQAKAPPRKLTTPKKVHEAMAEFGRINGSNGVQGVLFEDFKNYCDGNNLELRKSFFTSNKNTSIPKYLVKTCPDLFPSYSDGTITYRQLDSAH